MPEINNNLHAVVAKLELMQEYFSRLDLILSHPEKEIVDDLTLRAAMERNFQLIVDAAIDINTALIQEKKAQPSDDYQGTFVILASTGIIPHELAFAMAPSVGLRNALVDVYEEIKDIRASERMIYQKITDIYATAIDYSPKSYECKKFFSAVQNKLHFAITGKTAAEIITDRASSKKEKMGLISWRRSPLGKIMPSIRRSARNW